MSNTSRTPKPKPSYNLSSIGKVGETLIKGTFLRLCKEKFGTDENTALLIYRKALGTGAIVLDHYWGDDGTAIYRIAKHEKIVL